MKIFLNNEQNFVIHIFENNTIVMMIDDDDKFI